MTRWLLVALAALTTNALAVPQKDPIAAPTVASGVLSTEKAPHHVRLVKTDAEAAEEKAREAKTDEHDRLDLIAQQQSAEAAQLQVKLGAATLLVSGVAGIFLFLTMRDTRRAAAAAERSADIARTALRLSQRPWVQVSIDGVGPVRIQPDNTLLMFVTLVAKNVGSLPATGMVYNVYTNAAARNVKPEESVAQVIAGITGLKSGTAPPSEHTNGKVLFPGQEHVETIVLEVPMSDLSPTINRRDLRLVLFATAGYSSPLAELRHHTFATGVLCHKHGPVNLDDGIVIARSDLFVDSSKTHSYAN